MQIICAVNGPAVALQTNLVQAAAAAGTVKQFFPSEFGIFGAVGAACAAWPCWVLCLEVTLCKVFIFCISSGARQGLRLPVTCVRVEGSYNFRCCPVRHRAAEV